jgi:hypothetical protein
MNVRLCSVSLALFSLPLAGATCPAPQAKDGHALIQLEQAWAQALEVHDADAVGCILAEEFQDADSSPPGREKHPERT